MSKLVLAIAFCGVISLAVAPKGYKLAATCVGADPCLACANCKSCKHCRNGGQCGTCKPKGLAAATCRDY
jgi:hypothetical protein